MESVECVTDHVVVRKSSGGEGIGSLGPDCLGAYLVGRWRVKSDAMVAVCGVVGQKDAKKTLQLGGAL